MARRRIESEQDGGGAADARVVVGTEQDHDARSDAALVDFARRLGRDPAFDHVEDDDLEVRVRTGAAALAAATCGWLQLLGEFVVRGGWADAGARSPAVWLSWALGIQPSTAREQVRVALCLRELPLVAARFGEGTISYSKVRAISRIADTSTEALLLRWADDATAAQLESIVRDTRRIRQAQTAPAVRSDLGAAGSWREDNTYELRVRVDTATGVEVEQMLDRFVELAAGAVDSTSTSASTSEAAEAWDADEAAAATGGVRPTRRQVLGDAVVGALAAAIAAGPADASGADRHLAVVEMSAETYLAAAAAASPSAEEGGTSGASAEAASTNDVCQAAGRRARVTMVGSGRGGGRQRPVPVRQLARLVCSTRLDVTVHVDGHPADLGRARRDADAKLRRLLLARDRGCRFPGCEAVRFLEAHHVVPWADGGPTDLDNLVLLCGHHHRFIHNAEWALVGAGRGRWTFHPPGPAGPPSTLAPAHPNADRLTGASAGAVHLALEALAERVGPTWLAPPDFDGYGYDHDMAVGLLVERLTPSGAGAG